MKLNIRNLQNNFKAFDDRILYRYYEKDKISTLTYREVDQLSDKFALYLQSKGLKKGAKMAFYCDHYLDQVIAYFACLKIGVICIPLNMELDLNQLQQIIKLCQPDNFFISENTHLKIKDLVASSIQFFSLDQNSDFAFDLMGNDHITDKPSIVEAISGSDTAFIFFTSGSTGLPKGVMLSQHNIVYYALHGGQPYSLAPTDIFLCHSAFHSDMSLFSLFLPLSAGASCILIKPTLRWNPQLLSTIVKKEKVTVAFFVPSALRLFMLHGWEKSNIESIRLLFISGEKIHEKQLSDVQQLFSHAQLYNLFGNTESNDIFFFTIPASLSFPSLPLGKPLPYVNTILLNEQLEPCKENEIGELYVQSETLMQGYYGVDPTDTFVQLPEFDAPLFPTKDLLLKKNNLYYYIGRKDNMVKINAQRVFPTAIEATLLEHEGVMEAAVIPYTNNSGQHQLAAFVFTHQLTPIKLRELCAKKLPPYSIPKKMILLDHPLPKTSNGKIDYQELKNTLKI